MTIAIKLKREGWNKSCGILFVNGDSARGILNIGSKKFRAAVNEQQGANFPLSITSLNK